jgi:hypothetical protein
LKKVLEEIGKAILAFANIVTALVFLKDYFDKSNSNMIFYGIIFWFMMYILGSIFIKKSEEK